MIRAVVTFALIACAAGAQAATVPYVGCRSDGQLGPQSAPHGRAPAVPASAAGALAWYAMADGPGVLAPRNWKCFGLYGSNGATILVVPRPLDWNAAKRGGFTGPAVQRSVSSGETSGRFEVARIAARLFPAVARFVRDVEAEGLTDAPFARGSYAGDRVTHRGRYVALFTTPARHEGLGTSSRLLPAALPIDGVAILHPADGMDLDMLTARLPTAKRPLVAAIIAQLAPPTNRHQ